MKLQVAEKDYVDVEYIAGRDFVDSAEEGASGDQSEEHCYYTINDERFAEKSGLFLELKTLSFIELHSPNRQTDPEK